MLTRKKHIVEIVSIAFIAFLMGTMFNANFMVTGSDGTDDYGVPFDKIWTAISELQSKVDSLNASLTEHQSKVEDLEAELVAINASIANLEAKVNSLVIPHNASFANNYIDVYATSWTPIPNMTVVITLNRTSFVRITVNAKWRLRAAFYIRALIDSNVAHPGEIFNTWEIEQYYSMDFYLPSVTAGSHTVEIQCRSFDPNWPISFWYRALIVTTLPTK